MKLIKGLYNQARVYASLVDDGTLEQIHELVDQEFTKDSSIAIMPDCHEGVGCVIGTTMTISDKVVPFLVGVDVGCGMLVAKFKKENLSLEQIDKYIHEHIPAGLTVNKKQVKFRTEIEKMRCWQYLRNPNYLKKSMGTLGGGNHFIEIDIDDEGFYYLVIHTGSRNLGKQVAEFYQKKAVKNLKNKRISQVHELVDKLKSEGKNSLIDLEIKKLNDYYNTLKDGLCYLEGEGLLDYLFDMEIAQKFASENRMCILKKILKFLDLNIYKLEVFESIHNYINMKDMILRKGAISAYPGEKVIIPINMKDGCIIGLGKGNKEYNYSAPHGAGRLLSRKEAKENISLKDYQKSMEGIYSTCINTTTIDESCFAYKTLNDILPCIKDTVEVVKIIKPIYNFKSSEEQKLW